MKKIVWNSKDTTSPIFLYFDIQISYNCISLISKYIKFTLSLKAIILNN